MDLSDIRVVKQVLSEHGFTFKKSLGQNFIIDKTVCPKMAEAAADNETGVLEIGPGIGVLTSALCERAKKVVAVELDKRLLPILKQTLYIYNNVEVVFGDALKLDLNGLIKEKFSDCKRVCVCANLPYYITSPLVMKLLESKLNVDSITVMVQKEAAERLCATVGTRQAGAVSVAVSYYAKPEILFSVPRGCFLPSPNVDSAVIKLTLLKEPPITVINEEKFFAFVKACFALRRKTLINSVSNTMGINKEAVKKALQEIGENENVRAENLPIDQLCNLFGKLFV